MLSYLRLFILVTACCTGIFLSIITMPTQAKGIVPYDNGIFYYQLGGGQDVPMPAFYDVSSIPLNADGNVGLGFDCGSFNPIAAITDSLNNIKSSFINVESQVVSAATGAITSFPLYELSRSDPNLYNLLTDAMTGARGDMVLSTKSCEAMQSEIASGGDPYAHWAQISMGNKWKEEIGTAELSGHGDINQAKNKVSQDAGKSGVPWISKFFSLADSLEAPGSKNAGGVDQSPIRVIHDTVMAGYQDIVKEGGQYQSIKHSPLKDNHHSELMNVWKTNQAAAVWITHAVGEQTITTYNGGKKENRA